MKYLFFLGLLCISFLQAFAQEENKRPKIGLVLSGGGAKGLAHIGIIRALEEAGLTPDYVTGTSMGSIVGGLYAIGYTADEIEHMAETIDWNAILSNKISLDEITYEEKQYYGRYIVELSIDGIKVGLPKGLIEGQKLSELLSRLTRSVHDVEDFNELPIPFACVACDIETGEPVLLNKGSLPKAIRASMSIPTIFSPVELDDHLLVDGGLVRNFPVEEVIAMGADIVIGVFVSSDLEKKEDLDNLLSVLAQSAFVMSAFDSRKQKELVDIYIEPNLKEYSTGSFNQWENIIAVGDTVGEAYVEIFRNLADSVRNFGPLKTIKPYKKKDEYLVTDITVVGNEKISSEIIIGKLRIQEGSVLSIDEIEKQISIVYGTRFFDKVEYEIIRNGPKYELIIKVVEAPDGYLKLAVHYDSENDIGINANITYRNVLLPHSRALAEIDFSKNLRLDINYLKYIGKKQNAGLQIGMHFKNNELPLYEDGIKISTFDANYTDLYLGLQSTSFQNFTFGGRVQVEYSKLTPTVGEVGRVIEKIKNRDISATLFAEYNSFDRPFFPRRGSSFSVSVKNAFDVRNKLTEISEDSTSTTSTTINQNLDPFIAIELHYAHVFPIVKRFSIITRNSMVLTTLDKPNYNIIDYYFVGGFNPIFRNVSEYWGGSEKEYITPNYFYTKLIFQYEPFNNVFFSGIVNYVDVQYPMEVFYDIEVDDFLGGEKRRLGYGLSFGYNSPLGPLSVSLAWDSQSSKTLANINLGFWFK